MENDNSKQQTTTPGGGEEEEISYAGYAFSVMWGFLLGMFYATQQLFFTACLPPKQEAEMSGFFFYCTIILTSVAGSILLNAGEGPQWLLLPLVLFQALALIASLMCPGWSCEVEQAAKDPLRLSGMFDRQGTTTTTTTTTTSSRPDDEEGIPGFGEDIGSASKTVTIGDGEDILDA